MIGPHRAREKLSAGAKIFGPIVNFNAPWFIDMAGLIGFDFVLIDTEHGPMTTEGAEGLIRAAEAAGLSPLVRIPSHQPDQFLRLLDLGAVGIQVPHVESGEEAKAAADAIRYRPWGERGLALFTRAAGYGIDGTPQDYIETANREVILMPQIETAAGVENVDAIAATAGVDVIAIGPGDLSLSMGHAANRSVPEVQQAIDHVIARTKAEGKLASLPAADAASARQALDRGADMVLFATANWLVREGRSLLAAINESAAQG